MVGTSDPSPVETRYTPRSIRKVLCVSPKYTTSFGTMHHAYPLMPGVRAFMPPQGILVVAS
jgi:hopanoid C-2 methylase